MAEVGSAFVSILPSMKNFGSTMSRQLGPQIDGTGKTSGSRFGKFFSSSALAPMKGLVAGLGAMFVAQKIGGFLKDSIAEAREAAVVTSRTESVIKSMGLTSTVSAAQIGRLAMSISNKTAVDDEAVQSGQNLLLTFGNVAKSAGQSNGVFAKTSALMVDMSKAMGTDVKSSAIQLGKALNDPIKGVSALTRVGVSFSEQQKKQIANFVESGNLAKAQGVILGEVQKQFGGAAASMATPAERAQVAWANFKEQIGSLLLPVVDRLLSTISGSVIPAVSTFVTQIQTGTGAGGVFASVLSTVGAVFQTVASAVGSVVGFLNQHRTAAASLAVGIGALVAVTKIHSAAMAVQAAGGLAAMIKGLPIVSALTKAYAAVQWVLNAALTANPIGLVVAGIAALVAGMVIAYKRSETFRNIVNALWGALKVAIGWVVDLAGKLGGALVSAVGWVVSKVQDMIGWVRDKASAAWNALKDKAINAAQAILNPIQWVVDKVQALVSFIREKALGIWDTLKNKAVNAINAIIAPIQWVIDKVQALIDKIESIPGIPGGPATGSGTLVGGVPRLAPPPSGVVGLSTPSPSPLYRVGGSSEVVVVEMGPKTLRAMASMDVAAAREFGREINGVAAAAYRGV